MLPYGGTWLHVEVRKLKMLPCGGTWLHVEVRKLKMLPYGGTWLHIFIRKFRGSQICFCLNFNSSSMNHALRKIDAPWKSESLPDISWNIILTSMYFHGARSKVHGSHLVELIAVSQFHKELRAPSMKSDPTSTKSDLSSIKTKVTSMNSRLASL